ncbi:MAG: gas vesicle protein GvpG [Chloroflexi bacterium]|nr:gas vesicle protein GvpG [Chloroflexota bacterium]MCL5075485.1 gas vesicle protein GvpG [Chloroflexota bacterium]
MSFIFDLLTAPVLGPIKGVYWLAEKVAEAADNELLDEDRVRAELLELQVRLELGEIAEEEYDEQERILMDRLKAIREVKAERGR